MFPRATHTPTTVAALLAPLVNEGSHFAVWGFMPSYYALTGKRPTTRDVISQFQIWEHPQREYYRTRYLTDFNRSRPDVFVDATGDGNFTFKYSPGMPFESFGALRDIILSSYVLLLETERCWSPVDGVVTAHTRIFVSRAYHGRLGEAVQEIPSTPVCLRNREDLAKLVSSLRRATQGASER